MKTLPSTHPKGHDINVAEPGHYYGNHYFNLSFQRGPIGPHDARNGAFTEELLAVLIDRLEYFQIEHEEGKFACAENAEAIEHLKAAQAALSKRTQARIAQGVEGLNEPHVSEGEPEDATDVLLAPDSPPAVAEAATA